MISIVYIKAVDKELSWEGSDVALGNYNAAVEFNRFGILQGIKDWNERANPYVQNNRNIFGNSLESFIKKNNLSWIAFDKWKDNMAFEKYETWNNRPIMHPPLAPLALGLWISMFPFGHWSAEIFMILLEFASIILIFILTVKKLKNINRVLLLLLSIITAPVMIRYHNPSAEQLSMLLFLLSTYLIFDGQKASFIRFFFSGLLIGFTFYTKFNIIFFIMAQIILLFLYSKRGNYKNLIAYIVGILVVFCVFTIFGYYFWLTFLSGFIYAKQYSIAHPTSFIQSFSKLLYFGPTIIILFLILLSDFNKLDNKLLLSSVLLSLAMVMLYLWNLGTWNRYLIFYLPVIFSFLLTSKCILNLKKRDILIIPISNFIFIILNIYF
jgi:hypothetical protein